MHKTCGEGDLRESDYLEDSGVDGTIVLTLRRLMSYIYIYIYIWSTHSQHIYIYIYGAPILSILSIYIYIYGAPILSR